MHAKAVKKTCALSKRSVAGMPTIEYSFIFKDFMNIEYLAKILNE